MKKYLWDKGNSINNAIHDFTVGKDPENDMQLIAYDLIASAAAELKTLLKALAQLFAEVQGGTFSISHELEDCHTAIETCLVELVGDIGKKIHTGRSRNDQVLVAMRLYLRNSIFEISSNVIALVMFQIFLRKLG